MSNLTASVSSPSSFTSTAKPPSESPTHRPPNIRHVSSRYLTTSSFSSSFFQSSPSSANRSQSPTVTRTTRPSTPSATNRPLSTRRRQSVTPRRHSLDRKGSGEVSTAQRMLLTSGRSLFASFQPDSFTAHENRSKSPTMRKTISTATTIRSGCSQQQKSKLSEQWPKSLQPTSLSRSVDFTDTRNKSSRSNNAAAKGLQNSANVDLPARGIAVMPSNRLQHKLDPNSPVAKSNGLRKISLDTPILSPKGAAIVTTRSQLFPKREQIRAASPSKFGINATASSSPRGTSIARGISPSRGVTPSRGISPSGRMMSPLRMRSSLNNNNNTNTPLTLTFAVDTKKEKIRDNGVADAHLLKLFHNKLLQWRFANARANAVTSSQKIRAEKRLYNARVSISKLYDSARAKRIEMLRLKHNMKLISILSRQMAHLEEWFVVDGDYIGSLVGAAEALKGSTLCLPVDRGAMVNVLSVKDAICSAVDVMQAMASSICLLLPKVGKISCLAAELNRVNVKEQGMLDVYRDLLNTISALQVTECSLRTQAIQLRY